MNLEGCGTIVTTLIAPNMEPHNSEMDDLLWVYSGTKFSYSCTMSPPNNVNFFCAIDLPLSLVADTLILPVTMPLQIRKNNLKHEHKSESKSGQFSGPTGQVNNPLGL
jgi:uncharacterized protein YceK